MRPYDPADPVLGALAVVDVALDTLVAALQARYPWIDRNRLVSASNARQAQVAAWQCRALQGVLAGYNAALTDEIERERDIPF